MSTFSVRECWSSQDASGAFCRYPFLTKQSKESKKPIK